MSKRTWIIVGVVVAVPVLAIGWWLGSPLFLDKTVNEEFPTSADPVATDDTTEEEVEQELVEAAAGPDTTASDDTIEDGEPASISSGQFVDFDAGHRGSGNATIYELEDGSNVLRFENFEVTNGPELHVYLVPNGNPGSSADISGYVDLGLLKGNIGDQNYEIPDDVDVSKYGSVVIYCEPFTVIFSVASLN